MLDKIKIMVLDLIGYLSNTYNNIHHQKSKDFYDGYEAGLEDFKKKFLGRLKEIRASMSGDEELER